MALGYIIYAAALTYVATIAVSLVLYGGLDYFRKANTSTGRIEAVIGAVAVLFLALFHLEGFTHTIYREVSHGSLVSRVYLVAPLVLGFVSTDYLVRRILPLLQGLLARAESGSPQESGTSDHSTFRSRRSVLGVTLGLVTTTLVGSVTFLRDSLGSAIPDNVGSAFQLHASYSAPYLPTALAFSDRGYGFLTNIEGKIFRFEPPAADQESIQYEEVAAGISYPQGIEVVNETLYTVDNGEAAGGKYGMEEGYEVLQESNGKVIAFDIESDGSLTNKRTIVSKLPVINSDHALHQITLGPDDRLYLSIGHLGSYKYPELFDGDTYEPSDEDHPRIEYLGTVISFEPDGSNIEIVASGLRNVYDLAFDQRGNLYGANNDGMSIRSKVWESLCLITEGAYFGYPEYGTFDASPSDVDVQDPLWILKGVQSTGVETTDKIGYRDGVVVGIIGEVVFVPLERGENGVYVPEFLRPEPTVIHLNDNPIFVEAGPDGYLWVGTTGQDDTLSLYRPES